MTRYVLSECVICDFQPQAVERDGAESTDDLSILKSGGQEQRSGTTIGIKFDTGADASRLSSYSTNSCYPSAPSYAFLGY
jgi:hypothetical protein